MGNPSHPKIRTFDLEGLRGRNFCNQLLTIQATNLDHGKTKKGVVRTLLPQ